MCEFVKKVWLKIKSFILQAFFGGGGLYKFWWWSCEKGFLFTHALPSQGQFFILSFCLSINKTWNWLHTPSQHESQPLILSHSIWEEKVQKWLVWITFQMQYSCFKLNYCLSDIQYVVSLQFWSGNLGNTPTLLSHVNAWEHDERVNGSELIMKKASTMTWRD